MGRVLAMQEQVASNKVPRLSVVIPCYNEEDCLLSLHERVTTVCRSVAGDDYEIVLVNDGSRDMTWPIMLDLADRDPKLVCVDLARNHGQQLALTAGLNLCRGDRVFIIDADLQDPPELLGPMMRMMEEQGAEVVYGQRRTRAGESAMKKATAALFYRLLNRLAEIDIPQDTGDFRLMSRRALNIFLRMPEANRFVRGMISWIGMKQVPFAYDRDPRLAGTTKWPLAKMIRLTLDAITGFSTAPLKLVNWIAVLLSVCTLPLLVYTLVSWAKGHAVPGWTSLMVVVLVIAAVQMLVLGIMGEYLGRLYMEAKRRPLFVVRQIARSAPGEPDPMMADDQMRRGFATGPIVSVVVQPTG